MSSDDIIRHVRDEYKEAAADKQKKMMGKLEILKVSCGNLYYTPKEYRDYRQYKKVLDSYRLNFHSSSQGSEGLLELE